MRLTFIIFASLLLDSCSSKQTNEAPSFKPVKIVFLPSFLFSCELEIFDGNSPGLSIDVTRQNESDSIEVLHTRTFNITKEEFSVLVKGINSFNQEYSGLQTDFGLDGISVFIISDRLKVNDTIEFWSPRREGPDKVYYELLDPVFNIMRKYMTIDAEIMYVEQLEQYFDYGVPIKKISDKEYRIYGSLGYFEYVTKAINFLNR